MTSKQLDATGLDETGVVKMRQKHALATKYAAYLILNTDFTGYAYEPDKLVNWDGEYYRQEILPGHAVKTNDKLLDKITLGKITVN